MNRDFGPGRLSFISIADRWNCCSRCCRETWTSSVESPGHSFESSSWRTQQRMAGRLTTKLMNDHEEARKDRPGHRQHLALRLDDALLRSCLRNDVLAFLNSEDRRPDARDTASDPSAFRRSHLHDLLHFRAGGVLHRLPLPNGSRAPGQDGALGGRSLLRQRLRLSRVLVSLHLERARDDRWRMTAVSNTIDRFALATRAFIAWAESPGSDDSHAEAVLARRSVAALIATAIELQAGTCDTEALVLPGEEYKRIFKRFGARPFNYYTKSFNPSTVPTH